MLPDYEYTRNYYGKRIRFEVYYKECLWSMDKMFKENRDFDSWEEAFKSSLKAQRESWKYKKRSYKQVANRFPRKIINIFLNLLIDDLIYNDVEFVLNPRAYPENQYILKMGHFEKPEKIKVNKRMNKCAYRYGGMIYVLRQMIPKNWPSYGIRREFSFSYRLRLKIRKELKNGHRYYNSAKEHLLRSL